MLYPPVGVTARRSSDTDANGFVLGERTHNPHVVAASRLRAADSRTSLRGPAACATKARHRGLIELEERLVSRECGGIQLLPRPEHHERPATTSASARIDDSVQRRAVRCRDLFPKVLGQDLRRHVLDVLTAVVHDRCADRFHELAQKQDGTAPFTRRFENAGHRRQLGKVQNLQRPRALPRRSGQNHSRSGGMLTLASATAVALSKAP